MPTERFYHLSESKKELIREAAVKEFCRVPMEKVSINKIVQSAEISRGSFYTYFLDKEDLLWYLFDDFFRQVQDFCVSCLKKNSGDFWNLMEELMNYVLHACKKKQMMILAQTASGHEMMMQLIDSHTREDDGVPKQERWLAILYENTDCRGMRVNSEEDFRTLFCLCMFNAAAAVGDIYLRQTDEEEAMELYAKRLDFIRFGSEKRA